ncbi:MAG: hypothetical protein AB1792_07910 [Candidatus Zixiibacteriota bacterium]
MKRPSCTVLLLLVLLWPIPGLAQTGLFNYSEVLFGDPPTLFLWVEAVDSASGVAQLNGVEIAPTSGPFTWDWGDGTVYDDYFPQSHTYAEVTRNYIVSVISHYVGGAEDTAQTLVRFVPPTCDPGDIPSYMPITIPSTMPPLGTRLYGIPPNLSAFDDSSFRSIARETLEKILTVAAVAQMDFTNDGPYFYNSIFEEVMLRDSTFGGAYSIWFSDPVAFGVGDVFLQGTIGYSSLFHEMGHNFTLNTPAHFYYGGRIDGPANMIYSETMAQIYQHATGWALLNAARRYNLPDDLVFEITESVTSSMAFVRSQYNDYLAAGTPFCTWNDPPGDSAMQTFMTVAYTFCEHAETSGWGYRAPTKRMLHLLQQFDQYVMDQYDQNNNSLAADSARATLMIAAVSYAFKSDLRSEFAALDFPIDDDFYESLMSVGEVNTVPVLVRRMSDLTMTGCPQEYMLDLADSAVFTDPDGDVLSCWAESSEPVIADAWVDGTILHVASASDGSAKITLTADDGNGGTESTAFLVAVGGCNCACPCHADPQCDSVRSTVHDVVRTVDVAFRGTAPALDPQCPREQTDVNCDGATTVHDVVSVVDVAFRGYNPTGRFCDPCAP